MLSEQYTTPSDCFFSSRLSLKRLSQQSKLSPFFLPSYSLCVFSLFLPSSLFPLALITGFGAFSLYLCRSRSPGPFALWVLICVPMGAGWPVASAVGNEPPLTGRTCQQPLCPLPGLLVCRSLGSPARRCTGLCRLISIVSRSVGFLKRARKNKGEITPTLCSLCATVG